MRAPSTRRPSRSSSIGARCRSRSCSTSASSRARISRAGAASGRASVAALAIGGAEVRHARVPVRASCRRVSAHHAERRRRGLALAARDARQLDGRARGAAERSRAAARCERRARGRRCRDALYFDAGGTLPVASVALGFAASDGWARADVAASRTLDGPWMPVAYGELFYALSFEGREFASDARRGRPAGSALLARRAGGAAARPRRSSSSSRSRRSICASPSAAARRICSRPARWPRRPAPTRRSRRCGRRSSRRRTSCRSRRSARGASSADAAALVAARAFPVAHRRAVDRADRGRACRRQQWRLDSRGRCGANRPEVRLAKPTRSQRSFLRRLVGRSRSRACFGSRCRSAPCSRCAGSTRRRRP